jgi:BirA family biotin operon repressor/biotin-[acetyl-CoA-carboxylase] ligase
MDTAHALAEAGAGHGTAIAAREQDAGRGRRGRAWASPRGGLWLSVICRPASRSTVECLSLRAGLAVADALEAALPGLPPLQIKWPNDLYLEDRKVAGVLCEARWDGPSLSWIVAGVGVNVANRLPEDLGTVAVALLELVASAEPESLAEPVARAVAKAGLVAGPLDDGEFEQFRRRDWLWGRAVSAPVAGRAAGIARDGALLVKESSGAMTRVAAGEVLVRA